MAQKFNIGDRVRFLVWQNANTPDGDDVEVEVGEVGTIVGYNHDEAYPYSVGVEGKLVACWDDEAWHMAAHELELVKE